MNQFKWLITIFLLLGMTHVQAEYIEATLGEQETIQYDKRTVLFMVGKADDLEDLPFYAAYTRAQIIRHLDSEVQIVFYRVNEEYDDPDFKLPILNEEKVSNDEEVTNEEKEVEIPQVNDLNADIERTKLPGISIITASEERLYRTASLDYLLKFKKIQEIHFYGHSNPFYWKLESSDQRGIQNKVALIPHFDFLESDDNRNEFEWKNPIRENDFKPFFRWTKTSANKLEQLRNNIIPEGYITLNGCTSGFVLASHLSWAVQRPVMAALTGTMHQRYSRKETKTGVQANWYVTGYSSSWLTPKNPVWSNQLRTKSKDFLACGDQGVPCVRYKPDPYYYNGYWGDFSAGFLPHYKFFCNYLGVNDDDTKAKSDCRRARWKHTHSYPSIFVLDTKTTPEEDYDRYIQNVADFLCPSYIAKGGINLYRTCRKHLETLAAKYDSEKPKSIWDIDLDSSFLDNPKHMQCKVKECEFEKITCTHDASGEAYKGSCLLSITDDQRPVLNPIVTELEAYIKAFYENNGIMSLEKSSINPPGPESEPELGSQ